MSLISAFFGFDGANRMRDEAEQRAAEAQQLATQQQQQYYADMMKYMGQAGQAQQGAASDYSTYKQQGTQRYADATNALNGLLPQFGYAGGLGGAGGGANPYLPGGASPTTTQGGTGGTAGGNRTPPNSGGRTQPGGAAAALNRNQRATSTQNSVKDPMQAAQQAAQFDPYALTEAQSAQLNGQVERITNAKQTAIEQLRASYAQRGITDSRALQAGMQTIEEQFGGAAEQAKAQFLEQQRANKQQTIGQMLDFYTQQQGQGQQQQLQGIQGGEGQIQNLMQLAQNPALMNLLQFNNQNAMQNTQLAGQALAQNNIGQDLLGALGSGLGGYFGGLFNPIKTATQAVAPRVPLDYARNGRFPTMTGG